jgi:hypothetical protein
MLADVLPVWLQYTTDIAQILAAIGVIVAFAQLKASSKQFHEQLKISTDQFQTQLKLTQDQFKVLNQGFVKMTMTQFFLTNETREEIDPSKPIPLNIKSLYVGGKVLLVLENVGNLPVRIFFRHFTVYFDDKEFYSTPQPLLEQCGDILHPKTSGDFYMGTFPFNEEGTGLNLTAIGDLNISYKLLIEYYDYNDADKRMKTIDREARLSGDTIFNAHIYDKL